jgi:hypothetical protein
MFLSLFGITIKSDLRPATNAGASLFVGVLRNQPFHFIETCVLDALSDAKAVQA